MKYHRLDKEMRPCPGGVDWWLFCTEDGCDHEVHYGSHPYATDLKTYEVAHNLELLMSGTNG